MSEKRNNGIELLRLVLMFMICILHVLGHGGVLKSSDPTSLQSQLLWFMEVFSLCAVNTFALISGYTASDKPKQYDKLVNLWFQVLFYAFVINTIFTALGINRNITLPFILKSILPITSNTFWYMSSYFILFLSMPLLNKYIFSIDKNTASKMFIMIIILFSFIDIVCDAFVLRAGYSPIWLMVLYCLGALAKKIKLFENKKTSILIILWLVSILITWCMHVWLDNDRLTNYVSPTILLNGLIMMLLFSRIKLNKINIRKVSVYSLGIYLFQLNPIVWDTIIKNKLSFIASHNVFVSILLVLLWSGILFTIGLVVEIIRKFIFDKIKIPELSKKIVDPIDRILNKTTKLLS